MDKERDFIADLLGLFLASENSEMVAKILSRLDKMLLAVLGRLPEKMQGEVVYHLLRLREGAFGLVRWTVEDLGGVDHVVKIINRSGAETERNILEFVNIHDPELAEVLRSQVFVFDDIAYLNDLAIQHILREVDTKDLAVALKGGKDMVKARILANVSERVGEMILEEIENTGPVPVADVVAIQRQVVCTVRALDQAGGITIDKTAYVI